MIEAAGVEKVAVSPDQRLGETLKKFLDRWKIYTTHKLSRQRAIHKAVYSYNVRLKQKVLNSLSTYCIAAKKARSFSSHPTSICIQPNRIPKCEKAVENKTLDSGIFHYRHHSFLYRYIRDWRDIYLEKSRRIIELRTKAIELYDRSTLRKFFKLWLDSNTSGLPETDRWANARMLHNEKMVKKLFCSWVKYRRVKMERRINIQKIQEFYVNKLLRKSFRRIRANVGRELGKRQKMEKATNYHEKNLKQRFFNRWTNYFRKKKILTVRVNDRRERTKNALLEKTMKQWHLYVRHKKCCERKRNLSVNHHERKLREKSLNLLKKYLLYKKTKEISLVYLDAAIEEITLNILNVYMDKWRVAVVRVSQERQKIQRAKDHWRLRKMTLYLRMWREYSKNCKIKAKRNGILNEIGKSVLLEGYMELWMNNYRGFASTRLMEIQAASEYEKKIKSRLFRSWNKYVREKIVGKVMMEEAQEMHRRLLLRAGLKKILKNSLCTSELRYENRLMRVRQSCIDDFDTMKKFFARWLAFAWAKSTPKDDTRIIFRQTNENTLNLSLFDPASSRLVLPEYMINGTSTNEHDPEWPYQ